MMKANLVATLVFVAATSVYAQKSIQWDQVSVTLDSMDTDTVLVHLPSRPHGDFIFDIDGVADLKYVTEGQAAFVPDNLFLSIDSVLVLGVAADSFSIFWGPHEPVAGSLVTDDTTFVLGGTAAYGSIVDNKLYTLTLQNYSNMYQLRIEKADTLNATHRLDLTFIRKE